MSQKDVEEFLSDYSSEVQDLVMNVRALVLDVVPDANEKVYTGWKNIGYATGEKMKDQFCYITPRKSGLTLGFNQGTDLTDPENVLEGTGKSMRHVKISSEEDIDPSILRPLIKEAEEVARTQ